jgi:hypothetical protein
MRGNRKEHSMNRTAVVLGIAAAMGVFAPAAIGSTGQQVGQEVGKPAAGKKLLPVKSALTFHTARNSRTGQPMYRLGDTGLWME